MRDQILPAGLELVSISPGLELYRYGDTDGDYVEVAVDNSGAMGIWDLAGTPEMPYQTMRWLCARAECLTVGPRRSTRRPALHEPEERYP